MFETKPKPKLSKHNAMCRRNYSKLCRPGESNAEGKRDGVPFRPGNRCHRNSGEIYGKQKKRGKKIMEKGKIGRPERQGYNRVEDGRRPTDITSHVYIFFEHGEREHRKGG